MADDAPWPNWSVVIVTMLLMGAGFCLVEEAVHRPVMVPVDAALSLVALAIGAVAWRASPSRAIVRVLSFVGASPVVFACVWMWLAREVTTRGEMYGEYVGAAIIYAFATASIVLAVGAASVVGERAQRGSASAGAALVRRTAHVLLASLVLLALLGTYAALRRPAYERWLTSLPLRADFGALETWPDGAWQAAPNPEAARHQAVRYRELRIGRQLLRVYQTGETHRWTAICWRGLSSWETPPMPSSGGNTCTRSCELDGSPVRLRRDDDRGLWVIDYAGRHHSAVFNDLGARVALPYSAILSSAAPPGSWVVSAWVAAALAVALLRWPRQPAGTDAAPATPYRPRPVGSEPANPASLRDALALTICATHAAPLAAFFVRALVG